jgi:hypothetical protein
MFRFDTRCLMGRNERAERVGVDFGVPIPQTAVF